MTQKEANESIKDEILHELCLNNSKIKTDNFEYRRAMIEIKKSQI